MRNPRFQCFAATGTGSRTIIVRLHLLQALGKRFDRQLVAGAGAG